ncbi:hypothetical protein BH11BAC1_BH11BAC1_25860 [soil metagenome]
MKPRKYLFLVVVLFTLTCKFTSAQDQPVPPQQPPPEEKGFWDKIYIGGNLGLQFGTTTVINVSPQIGYHVTDKFVPGIGLTYIYYNFRDPYSNSRYETNIYGGSVFGKYFFTQNIFAHAEYEELNLEGYDLYLNKYTRLWVPSLFVGAGYNQPLGQRGFIQLLVLFEVLQDRNSPYYRNNPIVRIGFGF